MADRIALAIEPDTDTANQIRTLLEPKGFRVESIPNGDDAMEWGRTNKPAVIILSVEPRKVGYAISNKLPYASIKNASGAFVEPSLESVSASAASAKLPKDTDFRVSITNAPGAGSYPIASFTWLLVPKDSKDPTKAKLLKDFLTWMITPEAQGMANELHYASLPPEVAKLIEARLPTLKAGGKAIASK